MKTLETKLVTWIEGLINPPQPKPQPKDLRLGDIKCDTRRPVAIQLVNVPVGLCYPCFSNASTDRTTFNQCWACGTTDL